MIVVINYNSGNVASVCNALERLGQSYKVSCDPAEVIRADKVIFPGQGRARFAMDQLEQAGLVEILKNLKVPFLGICLGLQLLANFTEEDDVQGLGIFDGEVKKFSRDVRVPQIGWNKVVCEDSKLLDGVSDEYFYFVNSYYYEGEGVKARSKYGVSFAAVIEKSNYYGTQFHPEKSGEIGMKVLSNFCEL